ncbi:MAG: response regulator [Vicinamibacterales bacterium]
MKVLLVDDYLDALEALSLYLVAVGFDVKTASDGSEGLDLALVFRPDVIVLDVQMPGLSGLDVAAALKARPETADTPLIALSGRNRITESADMREAFASVMSKPCEPDALIAEIHRVSGG